MNIEQLINKEISFMERREHSWTKGMICGGYVANSSVSTSCSIAGKGTSPYSEQHSTEKEGFGKLVLIVREKSSGLLVEIDFRDYEIKF